MFDELEGLILNAYKKYWGILIILTNVLFYQFDVVTQ